MTYVEFFDSVPPKNICACLSRMPERVVLVGTDSGPIESHKKRYKEIFSMRGYPDFEILTRVSPKNDFDGAVKLIENLVAAYPDCSFDITGGDEIYLLALGAVFSKNRQLDIHSFNLKNNTVCDCDKNGTTPFSEEPFLSVVENVIAYGGKVRFDPQYGKSTYNWDMNDEFVNDIDKLWLAYVSNFNGWNLQTAILSSCFNAGESTKNGLSVKAFYSNINPISGKVVNKKRIDNKFLSDLKKCGAIIDYSYDDYCISVTFKNHQIKKILTTSGLLLEMMIFSISRTLTGRDGRPVYNDSLNGVVIEWDAKEDGVKESENEIDVLMMHGIVPVFVSCKNGNIGKEELYKLNAVSERFGSTLAKKVLVTTAVSKTSQTGKTLLARAKGMNIKVIFQPQYMTTRKLKEAISDLWR